MAAHRHDDKDVLVSSAGDVCVTLPTLTSVKVILYQGMREQKIVGAATWLAPAAGGPSIGHRASLAALPDGHGAERDREQVHRPDTGDNGRIAFDCILAPASALPASSVEGRSFSDPLRREETPKSEFPPNRASSARLGRRAAPGLPAGGGAALKSTGWPCCLAIGAASELPDAPPGAIAARGRH